MSARPFRFQTEVGAVRGTGYAAHDLREFVAGLDRVSGSSIYYHFFHSLYRRHFLTADYMHDFARWALVSLNLPPLAERLAVIDPLDFVSIREAREHMLETTRAFLGGLGEWLPLQATAPFYFLEQDSIIFATGQQATNLGEFARALEEVAPSSIYYHLIQAPIRLGRRDNDFSVWLEEAQGRTDLAQAIRDTNIHRRSIDLTRQHLVQLVRRAIEAPRGKK